ncbi:MAG TPA: cyclic nucleotide-binding domain-containing protein [Methylomirabilota bacterium]|nr:cyclic nucleotide-binding domain-containing protein [Methylomirabilota bacterium]
MQPSTEKLEQGEPLSTEKLLEHLPWLKEIPAPQLKWAEGAAVLRRFKRGDLVCEEGEFGSTAFYVLSGSVDVFIANQIAHVKTRRGFGGFVARMKSFLVSDREEHRDENTKTYIPIDASIDLSVSSPLAQLGACELFGEMTCRTFQPRSATVQAREDCVMVEMLRVILDMLMGSREVDAVTKAATKVKVPTFKGTSFKTELDKKYRERSLNNHLRSVPLFSSVDETFLALLNQKVELVTFGKSQVICKQGDPADAFFLIRSGMVKVSNALPGGEMVRTYLGRGDYFGEIGLLFNQPRSATCTALDTVSLVKIGKADFEQMLASFPVVRETLVEVADARLQASQKKELPRGLNLDEFLNQGLFEAQNLLVIDLDRCTRCDLCVRACAEAHDGVTRLLRDGLRYDKYLVATTCRTCRDPLCMTQCPVGSIRRKDNLEIIIEDWCIGCSKCAELCPFGNINMHPVELMEELKAAQTPAGAGDAPKAPAAPKKSFKAATCDLCTDLSTPSCVYACPHDAAKRVDPTEYFTKQFVSKSRWQQVKFEARTTHDADENTTFIKRK